MSRNESHLLSWSLYPEFQRNAGYSGDTLLQMSESDFGEAGPEFGQYPHHAATTIKH